MTSLKTSIKTITYLSDIGCLEIQGASLWAVRNDLIKKNMTEGLELKVPQRKASEARNAFSTEQVGQLLAAAQVYSQRPSGKPYHY